jgi:hypothetical protein
MERRRRLEMLTVQLPRLWIFRIPLSFSKVRKFPLTGGKTKEGKTKMGKEICLRCKKEFLPLHPDLKICTSCIELAVLKSFLELQLEQLEKELDTEEISEIKQEIEGWVNKLQISPTSFYA